MIVILGLILLVAAVVVGVAGVLANGGHDHAVTHFAVFGYHVTGSTGTLFLYGIVVGAVGLAGLSILLADARRTARRGREARRGLLQSRRETAAVSKDRDDLIDQRDTARAYTASTLGDGTPGGGQVSPGRGRRHLFGHRHAPLRRPPGRRARRAGRRPQPPPMRPRPQMTPSLQMTKGETASREHRQTDRGSGRGGQGETSGRLGPRSRTPQASATSLPRPPGRSLTRAPRAWP